MSDNASENPQNLSEILFKPKFDYPETSFISNGGVKEPEPSFKNDKLGFQDDFYRPILAYDWTINGGNPLDIYEALSRICVAHGERNRENCLDTIREYGNGHWNYEFNTIAQKRINKAHENEEAGDVQAASHNYRLASRYFAIAAYPFLKGDVLAQQSDVLCRKAYKIMHEIDPHNSIFQEHSLNVAEKKVTGYLHLPNLDKVYPCVIIVCPYESNMTAFYYFIEKELKAHNIAAFVIEMPGAGGCEKLNLRDNYSEAVEEAVKYLSNLNCIDATNIGIYGYGMAAAVAIRVAILSGNKVKALALTSPLVHSFFTDKKILHVLPLCLRSSLCNRLDLSADCFEDLMPQFKVLSLKEQGLLSGRNCKVNTFVTLTDSDFVSANDVSLLQSNFEHLTINRQPKDKPLAVFHKDAMTQIARYFGEVFYGQG